MVYECRICSKEFESGNVCPYCGFEKGHDFKNVGSFKKVKNSLRRIFGNGLSKQDKKDYLDFIFQNKSKLQEFIDNYSKPLDKIIFNRDGKKEYKNLFDKVLEITKYIESGELKLSFEYIKLCYTFKRFYDEFDDILANLNKDFCSIFFKKNSKSISEFNDFINITFPHKEISKDDITEFKSKYLDIYEGSLIIKKYYKINASALSYKEKYFIFSFISDYENIEEKVKQLNFNFKLKIKQDLILTNVGKLASSNNVKILKKEKEDYLELYNFALDIVNTPNDFEYQIPQKIRDKKHKFKEFIKKYESFDVKISKFTITNWINYNKKQLDSFNSFLNEKQSAIIDENKINELKDENSSLYNEALELKKEHGDNFESHILNSFIHNFENLEDKVKDKNCLFQIDNLLEKIISFDSSKYDLNELINKKEEFKDYFISSKKVFKRYKSKITEDKLAEFNYFIEDYEKIDDTICEMKISNFIRDNTSSLNRLLNFIKRSRKREITDKRRYELKKEFNPIYTKVVKILDVHKTHSKLSKEDERLFLKFKDTFENLDLLIDEINYKLWLNNNIGDIETFVEYKNKELCFISPDLKNKIKSDFSQIYKRLNDLVEFYNKHSIALDESPLINEFICDFKDFDNIVFYLNSMYYIKNNLDTFNQLYNLNKINPNRCIDDSEKEEFIVNFKNIGEELIKINSNLANNSYFNKDRVLKIECCTFNYENIGNIITYWNRLNNILPNIKLFIDIGNFVPKYYFSYSRVEKILDYYKSIKSEVKEIEKLYSALISQEIKDILDKFHNKSKTFKKDISKANKLYLNHELEINKEFFDNIEDGKSLDSQQRDAIVMDEDNVRVIAGAGTGKTFTIQGKVKYLVEKKGISPDEILLISFSNSSVDDLESRITEPVVIKTFHKVGMDILEGLNLNSKVEEDALKKTIDRYMINKALKDPELSKKLIEFFSYYINVYPTDEVKTQGELLDFQKNADFSTLNVKVLKNEEKTTIKREYVKSYEELYIANFLFIHGVNYTYEKIYSVTNKNYKKQFNTFKEVLFSNNPNFCCEEFREDFAYTLLDLVDIKEEVEIKNYAPDFYLEDYDIFLEHFGLDRNCQNSRFSKEELERYIETMNWKRDIHTNYGSKLLETYSYYQSENRLLSRLKEKLENEGVKLNEINYQNVYRRLIENKAIRKWKDFINLIQTFIELFKGNAYTKEKFKEFNIQADKIEDGFTKDRTKAFLAIVEEVYDDYESYLKNRKKIDFNDMINNASRAIVENELNLPYKYIIVDEYQDTSYTRYNLLKQIQNVNNCKIMVVGDDWQSIYSFSGCDVNIFTGFENFFEGVETVFIEKTYRNSQELIDVSGNFVMKNPLQSKKDLKSDKFIKKPIKILRFNGLEGEVLALEKAINKIARTKGFKNEKILILGRNNADIFYLLKNKDSEQSIFKVKGDLYKLKDKKYIKIRYNPKPQLDIEYRTVHQSKGLQAENVILINLKNSVFGFPNQMTDDPLLDFVKLNTEEFSHAEERRLFYVALTRTENNVYLLAPNYDESIFVKELMNFDKIDNIKLSDKEIKESIEKNKVTIIPTKLKCPKCGTGDVLLKFIRKDDGSLVPIFDCSHDQTPPFNRCGWDGGYFNGLLENLEDIDYCNECDGIYYLLDYEDNPFKTCSKFSKTGCDGNKKHKLDVLCPECGKPLYHMTKRETGYEQIKCYTNGCKFRLKCNKNDLKYVKQCPECGGILHLKNGRFGPFIGCSNYSNYLKCKYTEDLP